MLEEEVKEIPFCNRKVRELRKLQVPKMSLTVAANLVGKSPAWLSELERGKIALSVEMAVQFSFLFKCSSMEFFDETPPAPVIIIKE